MTVKDEIYQLVRSLDEARAYAALRLLRVFITAESVPPLEPNPDDDRERIASAEPFSLDDPLWNIVGMIDDEGPTDVSENRYHYLAEAYRDYESE